jgi:uncharacterized protein YukE
MAILHMDVDACHAAQRILAASKTQLDTNVNTMRGAVIQMLASNWIAPGAITFSQDFRVWNDAMTKMLGSLDGFANNLNEEVGKWEEVASAY